MSILIKPILTEKAVSQSEVLNAYAFQVNTDANKVQIKNEIESIYGVSVVKVNTINVRPDRNTRYTKTGVQHGKTKAIKKALVYVSKSDTIDIYENIN